MTALPWGMILRSALAYFAVTFGVAAVLGTFRVLVIAPQIGAVAAVLLEVPVILAVSWVVAGRVLRRWPVAAGGRGAVLAMGALAFAMLMLAEVGLAALTSGRPPGVWLGSLVTPDGAIGLAGQICFALIPWLRSR